MKRKRGKRGPVKVWTVEEEGLLLTMKDDGYKEEDICEALGRSRGSIVCRLSRLGYYNNTHSYTRRELPSGRPVCMDMDEAIRVAYRLAGIRDFEYNPGGEKAELPLTA